MNYELIDTHCHLDFPDFDTDRPEVLQRAHDNDIDCIINIGSSLQGSQRSVALSKEYKNIYAVVGVHPHEADGCDEQMLKTIAELAKEEKVVAIGETGLDYFKNYSSQENQKRLFCRLISLAKDYNLPLVLHSRQAQADMLEILQKYMPLAAVVHCFSGDGDFLKECLAMGFFISFTCNITYKKAEELRMRVKETPLERLMLETDAPFLSPEGFRGRRNEPAQVKLLAQEIAKVKGSTAEVNATATTENARIFFKLM